MNERVSDLLFARIDPTRLYRGFFRRLSAMLEDAQKNHGANYWVISGFRSYAEQDELHAQGRTLPGPVVTKAKGGQSAHNFGIAADLVLDAIVDRRGLQPDWRPESYELLRTLAPAHGLVWGGSWQFVDRPHVQLPGLVTSAELQPLRDVYEAHGMFALFDFLKEKHP